VILHQQERKSNWKMAFNQLMAQLQG
jgi:hypothetical protein